MQKKSHVHVNSFLKAQKKFLMCMQKSVFLFFYFRAFKYVVLSINVNVKYFRAFKYVVTLRKSMKKLRKYKYLQMTVLYTKYKAENNVV